MGPGDHQVAPASRTPGSNRSGPSRAADPRRARAHASRYAPSATAPAASVGPVRAIGSCGQRHDAVHAVELERGRQRPFLAASARCPLPRTVTVVSPPAIRQAGGATGPRPSLDLAGQAHQRARHVPRLALERAGEDVRRIAERARLPRPRPRRPGDCCRSPYWSRRGRRDPPASVSPGSPRALPARSRSTDAGQARRERELKRSRIASASAKVDASGARRAGGDDVERIADHVGEQQRVHAGGRGGPGELAALEPRAVLPHRV